MQLYTRKIAMQLDTLRVWHSYIYTHSNYASNRLHAICYSHLVDAGLIYFHERCGAIESAAATKPGTSTVLDRRDISGSLAKQQ